MKNLSSKDFMELLQKLNACEEARVWAEGKDLKIVWEICERGDWLLWLVSRMIGKSGWPRHQSIVLASCACAELSLLNFEKVFPKDNRPRLAIETARKWAKGKATIEEVRSAAESAESAYSAAWSAESAYSAAELAAESAWSAAWSAYSAAWSAYSAAWSAAYSAYSAAWSAGDKVLKQCADIVRKELNITFEENKSV